MPTISTQHRTARRIHSCHARVTADCRGRIDAGQTYWRLYGNAESSDPPYVLKVCEPCQAWYDAMKQQIDPVAV